MNGHSSRKELLDQINAVSFTVNDLTLFLDTHPCNEEALDCFYKYQEKRTHMLKEYASCYGPLTLDTAASSRCDKWKWINEPWPWQEGGC